MASEEQQANLNFKKMEVAITLNQADARLSSDEEAKRLNECSQMPDWTTYNPTMAVLSPIHRFGELCTRDITTLEEVSNAVGAFKESNKTVLIPHDNDTLMHQLAEGCTHAIIYSEQHSEFKLKEFPNVYFRGYQFYVKMTKFKLFVVAAAGTDNLFEIIDYFFYQLF